MRLVACCVPASAIGSIRCTNGAWRDRFCAGSVPTAETVAYRPGVTTLATHATDTIVAMKTVLLGAPPAEIEALLTRRRALGQDLFDEVWEGDYHVSPAPHWQHGIVGSEVRATLRPYARRVGLTASDPFNLGTSDDYRVPDGGFHHARPRGAWVPEATIVLEVVSPDDETFEKFAFYAAHGVREVIVAVPEEREVRCYDPGTGEQLAVSKQLGVGMTVISADLDWPA